MLSDMSNAKVIRDLAGHRQRTKNEQKLRKDYNAITNGVIWKELIRYVLPLIFGTFFQQLYNTIDAVVVGRFVGKEALSAVGGTSSVIVNLFVGFFVGLSSGASVICAQYFGAEKREELSHAVHTGIALSIISGLGLMLIGTVLAPMFTLWMHTPEEIRPLTTLYLRIYFLGMVPNLLYNMAASILRAVGDSKRPLYFLIVSCILNILLDLLLVLRFRMGVAGVAIATILCQLISSVLAVLVLMRTHASYRLFPRKIRMHHMQLEKIVSIGIPAGLQALMYSISNVVIQTSINGFGTNNVAAWTAYEKLDAIFWLISSSFGVAITTFIGQNYGAVLYHRVHQCIRQALVIITLVFVSISSIFCIFGPTVLQLFTEDASVLQIGTMMVRFLSPFYFTYIGIEVFSSTLRGLGDAVRPMLISLFGICVLRVIWILVAVPRWHSVKTVMLSYIITWAVTSILYMLYYRHYTRVHGI